MTTLDELANRRLTPSEFTAYADSPLSDRERQDLVDLIRWFTHRYPTPAARLRSNRRALGDVARRRGIALPQR